MLMELFGKLEDSLVCLVFLNSLAAKWGMPVVTNWDFYPWRLESLIIVEPLWEFKEGFQASFKLVGPPGLGALL